VETLRGVIFSRFIRHRKKEDRLKGEGERTTRCEGPFFSRLGTVRGWVTAGEGSEMLRDPYGGGGTADTWKCGWAISEGGMKEKGLRGRDHGSYKLPTVG